MRRGEWNAQQFGRKADVTRRRLRPARANATFWEEYTGYTMEDIFLAHDEAVRRGEEAQFKAALRQATFQVDELGVSEEEAFFELLGTPLSVTRRVCH